MSLAKDLLKVCEQGGGIVYNDDTMIRVLDNFVRFLVGDPKVALSHLQELGNSGVDLDPDRSGGGSSYNELYDNLLTGFKEVVERNLR